MTEQNDILIYHIAEVKDWRDALETGSYRADSLKSEGFIHCSRREQLWEVAQRLFAGRQDIVVLEIHPASLPVEIRYEAAPNGVKYPHVYGEIPLEAVHQVLTLNWERKRLE
ncbi:MAG: DUF952 domain-containing protein [Chloroflexota bacterium]